MEEVKQWQDCNVYVQVTLKIGNLSKGNKHFATLLLKMVKIWVMLFPKTPFPDVIRAGESHSCGCDPPAVTGASFLP